MSFMRLTCPWCGTEYTFGVVGSQQIGSGHRCSAFVECETDDCTERGFYSVVTGRREPRFAFSCGEHVGRRAIAMCQVALEPSSVPKAPPRARRANNPTPAAQEGTPDE